MLAERGKAIKVKPAFFRLRDIKRGLQVIIRYFPIMQ